LTNLSLSRLTNPHPTTSSLHAAFATVAAAAAAAAASSKNLSAMDMSSGVVHW
jgi:hypothetical protein